MKQLPSKTRYSIMFMISSLYGGGAEKVCCVLASEMAKQHDVTIVYFADSEKQYPIDPRCRLIRFPYRYSSMRNPILWLYCLWKNIHECRNIKKDVKADISVSLLITPNLFNVLTSKGNRVICSERANPKKYQRNLFWLTKLIYSKADHVVFQSHMIQNLYSDKVKKHSSIIMNPVSVSCKADPVRSSRVVALGRLTEQKNYKMLIRSFAAFHEEYPDYTLSIYGEGEQGDELQNMINSLDIKDFAFLKGNSDQVHQEIKDAQIFVLSSNFEGLSNALLEAMTMGLACISTRCEGSEDVIRNGENGLLIPIGDENALTNALKTLAADPKLCSRISEQAALDAKAFDREEVVKQWEKVFFDRI